MNCNHWWQRPVLIAGLLVCGASLGVHQLMLLHPPIWIKRATANLMLRKTPSVST